MTPERQSISSKNIQQLLYELRTGALNPVEVLEAYQAKALHVDKEINAVCDFILSAADWAQHLLTVPETERGPLYGLPVSVKVSHYISVLCNVETIADELLEKGICRLYLILLLAGMFLRGGTRQHHRPGSAHRPAGRE